MELRRALFESRPFDEEAQQIFPGLDLLDDLLALGAQEAKTLAERLNDRIEYVGTSEMRAELLDRVADIAKRPTTISARATRRPRSSWTASMKASTSDSGYGLRASTCCCNKASFNAQESSLDPTHIRELPFIARRATSVDLALPLCTT